MRKVVKFLIALTGAAVVLYVLSNVPALQKNLLF
jgi:hypothetical protein